MYVNVFVSEPHDLVQDLVSTHEPMHGEHIGFFSHCICRSGFCSFREHVPVLPLFVMTNVSVIVFGSSDVSHWWLQCSPSLSLYSPLQGIQSAILGHV